MKKQRAVFVFLVLTMILAFVAAGCGNGAVSTPVPQKSGPIPSSIAHPDYLRLPEAEPHTLDPALVTDSGSHGYVMRIFSGLVKFEPILKDKKTGQVIATGSQVFTRENRKRYQNGEVARDEILAPDIAESLPEPTYNADGTISYVFKIRDGVKFHDGSQREVTAYDFAYSLDRAADPKTNSTAAELYLGDIVGVMDMLRGRIINKVAQNFTDMSQEIIDLPGVQVIDAKTLKITTQNLLPYIFLSKMTYTTAFVVDKFQVEKTKEWIKKPNGTGPYRILDKGVQEIVLVASDVYYGEKPHIPKLVFYLGGSSSFQDYRAGERDMSGVDLEYLDEVRDPNSEFHDQYFEAPELSTSYIGFNVQAKPFDDPKVRQAFTLAIDKETLANNVLKGMAPVAWGILPPGMPGYRDNVSGLRFDPARARQLLSESKYGGPAGLGTVKITTSSGAGGSPSEVLQAIIQMWKDNLGVDVLYDTRDYALYLETLGKGDFQMFSMGWIADYPDPENFLDLKFHSKRSAANNTDRYANPEVDRLLDEAKLEKDTGKRLRLYQQAEDIIIQDAVWLPLFNGKEVLLVKPYIANYLPTRMGVSVLPYLQFIDK